jgi:hypothetical protein
LVVEMGGDGGDVGDDDDDVGGLAVGIWRTELQIGTTLLKHVG